MVDAPPETPSQSGTPQEVSDEVPDWTGELEGLWKGQWTRAPDEGPSDLWIRLRGGKLHVAALSYSPYILETEFRSERGEEDRTGRILSQGELRSDSNLSDSFKPTEPIVLDYRLAEDQLVLSGQIELRKKSNFTKAVVVLLEETALVRDAEREEYLDLLNANAPARVNVEFVRVGNDVKYSIVEGSLSYKDGLQSLPFCTDAELGELSTRFVTSLSAPRHSTLPWGRIDISGYRERYRPADFPPNGRTGISRFPAFQIERIPNSNVRIEYQLRKQKLGLEIDHHLLQSGVVWEPRSQTKVVKEIPVAVAKGDTLNFEDEHTVRHTWSIGAGASLKTDLGVNWAFVQAGIEVGIEANFNKTSGESTTKRRSIQVRGGPDGKALVLVVEEYRVGRLIVIDDGKRREVPIEFRDGYHFESRLE